jgi:hypothetical protein
MRGILVTYYLQDIQLKEFELSDSCHPETDELTVRLV